MSKTVLLPDDLHKQIQDAKVETKGVEIKMSIAKKIGLYFEWYSSKNIYGTTEMVEQFLYKSIIDMLNNSISQHPAYSNDFEKGYLQGMKDSVKQIKMAKNYK